MSIKQIFFSWDGRSAGKSYWIGIWTIEIAILVGGFIAGWTGIPTLAVNLVFVYPRICVLTKRFHDFNRSGWWQVLANIVITLIGGVLSLAGAPIIGSLTAIVLELGFIIGLGLVKGQPHNNDFGPPPGVRTDVVEVFG
jgi:uncharacterized membrane protein YhaH (DUF805 family)